MNDEIKEIKRQLKYLENWLIQHQRYKIMGDLDSIFSFNLDDLQKFYDYITNLQQINKNLTNSLNKKVEEGIKLQLENDKLREENEQYKKTINEIWNKSNDDILDDAEFREWVYLERYNQKGSDKE